MDLIDDVMDVVADWVDNHPIAALVVEVVILLLLLS